MRGVPSDVEIPKPFWSQHRNLFGETPLPEPSLPVIEEKDFILVIQTPLQAAMLKEFGNNIILIDSTHRTTGYDFQLITIVVVDELGEGYPIAWCLSNREDQIVLTGTISPSWFMSDDADQFYGAWTLALVHRSFSASQANNHLKNNHFIGACSTKSHFL